ncbi:peptidoglycan editing factor PgeF [Teredinibacter franksiae]|uniref:peptidoglycan editing factor PgeF n=1 Tax=Teredinibacter franksiae TaxID=2761453 RepID=UPI00162702C4|nr:peptidoglycan editing factor PgeF [Teredinibacter franksiae]
MEVLTEQGNSILRPTWPLPSGVNAFVTTRHGGVSDGAFDSNNLGLHVGDDVKAVEVNRRKLLSHLPSEPMWLNQTHSTRVIQPRPSMRLSTKMPPNADGVFTRESGQVCAVMTADCLPVLFCAEDGSEIAAVHAGWRGLANGILPAALLAFRSRPHRIMAYLGPAISALHFVVGVDVYRAFGEAGRARGYASMVDSAFRLVDPVVGENRRALDSGAKLHADLFRLARLELESLGVSQVFGGDLCTYSDQSRFYSYRRDGRTGRFTTLIWKE